MIKDFKYLIIIFIASLIVGFMPVGDVCLDFGNGEIICFPPISPISPASQPIKQIWLPVIWK